MGRALPAIVLVAATLLAGCAAPAPPAASVDEPLQPLDETPPAAAVRFHWAPDDGAGDVPLAASLWQPEGGATSVVLAVHGSGGKKDDYGPIPVPSYSFAHAMVADGRAFLAIDLPGYGESDQSTPQTMDDMALLVDHAADALRTGDYEHEDGDAPSFTTVVGLGISIGGLIVQIAQGYHNSFDGVISGAWTYGGFSEEYKACYWRGEGCPDNMLETVWYLPNVEPEVVEWLNSQAGGPRPLGPVGAVSVYAWAGCAVTPGPRPRVGTCDTGAAHEERVRTVTEAIRVPLLLVFGEKDFYWDPEVVAQEPARFVNAPDVNLMVLPDTGHVHIWHRTNDELHARQNAWLDAHGF